MSGTCLSSFQLQAHIMYASQCQDRSLLKKDNFSRIDFTGQGKISINSITELLRKMRSPKKPKYTLQSWGQRRASERAFLIKSWEEKGRGLTY